MSDNTFCSHWLTRSPRQLQLKTFLNVSALSILLPLAATDVLQSMHRSSVSVSTSHYTRFCWQMTLGTLCAVLVSKRFHAVGWTWRLILPGPHRTSEKQARSRTCGVRKGKGRRVLDYQIGYRYWLLSVTVYRIIGISVKIHISATLLYNSYGGMHLLICVVYTVYMRSAISLVQLVNPKSQIHTQKCCLSKARPSFGGWKGWHTRLDPSTH